MKPIKNPNSNIYRLAAVFFCSFIFLVLSMDRTIGIYDEGVTLVGAMRVAAGEIPHRDFYANYGPAQFYIFAFLFRLFGQTIAVERLYDVITRALIVTACYGAIAPYCRRSITLAMTTCCALWLTYIGNYGSSAFQVILLSIVSSLLIISVLSASNRPAWRLLAAGAGTGLAALFRYDAGFFLLAAHTGAMAIIICFRYRSLLERWNAVIHIMTPYVMGTAAVFLPAAYAYLKVAPIEPFIHDIVTYPSTYYARMRSLPFPGIIDCLLSLANASIYVPIVTVLTAIAGLAESHKNHKIFNEKQSIFLIVFCLLIISMYSRVIVRTDVAHVMLSFIPSLLIAAVLLDRDANQSPTIKKTNELIMLLIVMPTTFISLLTIVQLAVNRSSVLEEMVYAPETASGKKETSLCKTPPEFSRIACFTFDQDRMDATRFLILHTNPGERIFVGVGRHDKIFINDISIYFATGRLPATKWHHFDPGLQTRADIQSEIIQELDTQKVRYLLLDSLWDSTQEPNESAKSSGVTLLDEYIRKHYRSVEEFGTLSVWLRNADR